VAGDVNKTVVGATTGHTGTLRYYNNGQKLWVVEPTTSADLFNDPDETVSVSGGTGTGTLAQAATQNPTGTGGGEALKTARDTFETARLATSAAKAAADVGTAHHVSTLANVQNMYNQKVGAALGASAILTQKEAAYATAQAATQTAYSNLATAYDNAKAACPTWTPDPPMPAQP
jgi:hypothetical protein